MIPQCHLNGCSAKPCAKKIWLVEPKHTFNLLIKHQWSLRLVQVTAEWILLSLWSKHVQLWTVYWHWCLLCFLSPSHFANPGKTVIEASFVSTVVNHVDTSLFLNIQSLINIENHFPLTQFHILFPFFVLDYSIYTTHVVTRELGYRVYANILVSTFSQISICPIRNGLLNVQSLYIIMKVYSAEKVFCCRGMYRPWYQESDELNLSLPSLLHDVLLTASSSPLLFSSWHKQLSNLQPIISWFNHLIDFGLVSH